MTDTLTYNLNCKERCYNNHSTPISITLSPNTEEAYQYTANGNINNINYILTIDNTEVTRYVYKGSDGTLKKGNEVILTDVYQYPELYEGEGECHNLTYLHEACDFEIPYTFTTSGTHTIQLSVVMSVGNRPPNPLANITKTITSVEADTNPAPVVDGHAYLLVEDELTPGVYTITGTYATNEHYIMDLDTAQLEVLKKTTNITVTTNKDTVKTGENLTFSIQVENTLHDAVTSGTYSLYEDNTRIQQGSLSGNTTTVTITPTATSNSYHTYKVVYLGTSIYNGCTSSDLTINVTKITPVVTIDSGLQFYPDTTTNVTGTVTHPDTGEPLGGSKCLGKINSKTIKDSSGKVIYSTIGSDGRFSIPFKIEYNFKPTSTYTGDIVRSASTGYNTSTGTLSPIPINYVDATPIIDFNLAPLVEPVASGEYTIQATIHLTNPAVDLANTICKIKVDGNYINRPNTNNQNFPITSSGTLNQLSTPLPISVGYGETHTITIEVQSRTLNYYNIQSTTSTATISLGALETMMPHTVGLTPSSCMMELNTINNVTDISFSVTGEFTPTVDNTTTNLQIEIQAETIYDLKTALDEYGMDFILYNKTRDEYLATSPMGVGLSGYLVNMAGLDINSSLCTCEDIIMVIIFDLEENEYIFDMSANEFSSSSWAFDPNTYEPTDEIILILEQYDEDSQEYYYNTLYHNATIVSEDELPLLEYMNFSCSYEPNHATGLDSTSPTIQWDSVDLLPDSDGIVKAVGSPCDSFIVNISEGYPLTDFDKDFDILLWNMDTEEIFSFQGNTSLIENVLGCTPVSGTEDSLVEFFLMIDTTDGGSIVSNCYIDYLDSTTFCSNECSYSLILYNLDDEELENAIVIDLIPEE